jgi:hypothetical protein
MAASADTGSWVSGINFQNIDTITAYVFVEFYDPNHRCSDLHLPANDPSGAEIAVGGNIKRVRACPDRLADGRYSAVISSNARVAAVVNTQNRTEDHRDSYLRIESPSDNVVAPLVYRNLPGYTTPPLRAEHQ